MKRKNIISTLACSIAALAFTACTDVWEEHYQPNPVLNSNQTLWDIIESDPQLTSFKEFLEVTGYDTLLTKNRYYTVWAPTNDAEFFKTHSAKNALGNKNLLDEYRKELVENHIADYSHVAGGKLDDENLIRMLNGKYICFENASGNFTFKGIPLNTQSNVSAKNGILHKIDGYAEFTANIWEQLAKEESLDSLYNFLFKDYKREPNWSASVQGPMVDGKPVILDTAWTVTCPWFNSLGQLNREDSSYTMFALTNRAWDEMYQMTKEYFVYAEDYGRKGDSIQESVVKELMCSNLVFSNRVNKGYANNDSKVPYDTLISNYYFSSTYEPVTFAGDEVKALYNGATTLELSNGTLNIVDEVNYNPLKCWHDSIRVEGENLSGGYVGDENATLNEYVNATKEIARIDKDSLLYDSISNGAIGVFKNEVDNPILDFKIKNVLSARYKIKVVVLPPHIINSYDTLYIKPNKFYATLTCGSRELSTATQDIVLGRKDSCETHQRFIFSDPSKIDTIDLVPLDPTTFLPLGEDYVEIPVCEYQEEGKLNGTFQTKLNITSCLGAGDETNIYELTYMSKYKKTKNEYVEAIKALNKAKEDYIIAEKTLEDLTAQDPEAPAEDLTEEELEQKEKDIAAAEKALEKAGKTLDKAQEEVVELKEDIAEMDKGYLKYLDSTLRIDQIILVPWNPNEDNE